MPCYGVNFHRLKSYPLISKPHVFKDEIIRLNSIQDERVFSCCLFKGRCYSMSDAGISKNQRKKTLIALTLFPSFLLMIKKVTDYEKLWPICWYDDWSERICSSVNDTECSVKKLRVLPMWAKPTTFQLLLIRLPQKALGDSWRAKLFN